jgi:hypothetical protein
LKEFFVMLTPSMVVPHAAADVADRASGGALGLGGMEQGGRSIAAESPAGAATAIAAQPMKRTRKAWKPGQRDHLVYQWVRMEGKQQTWVAGQLELSQSTVSRILSRYDKWIAHAQPGDDGRLSAEEQLRTQLWLTYARNEAILTACLRIAGEMEGFVDVSQSVVQRPLCSPKAQKEVRTVHSRIDRTSTCARFLRLAFRINMEQLKLVERTPLAPLEPLTEQEEEEVESGGVGEAELAAEQRESAGDELAAEVDAVEGEGGEEASNMHNVHTAEPSENGANNSPANGCAKKAGRSKRPGSACKGVERPVARSVRLSQRPDLQGD